MLIVVGRIVRTTALCRLQNYTTVKYSVFLDFYVIFFVWIRLYVIQSNLKTLKL